MKVKHVEFQNAVMIKPHGAVIKITPLENKVESMEFTEHGLLVTNLGLHQIVPHANIKMALLCDDTKSQAQSSPSKK